MLTYIDRTMRRSTATRSPTRTAGDGLQRGDGDFQRVYPFVSYFEVLARFGAGRDASALELIKREWGFMLRRPGNDVGDDRRRSGNQVDGRPSWDHGWSSGAAPALTSYVLGVQPASPASRLQRHPASGRADVGARDGADAARPAARLVADRPGELELQVTAPPGTVWDNPAPQSTGALSAADSGDDDAGAGTTTLEPLVKVELANSSRK